MLTLFKASLLICILDKYIGSDFTVTVCCVLNWIEHGASMVGEFLSGGVCQNENRENCSSEAVMDGRLTKGNVNFVHVKESKYVFKDWIHVFTHTYLSRDLGLWDCSYDLFFCLSVTLYMWASKRFYMPAGDSSHLAVNLGSRVVMGLDIVESTGGF